MGQICEKTQICIDFIYLAVTYQKSWKWQNLSSTADIQDLKRIEIYYNSYFAGGWDILQILLLAEVRICCNSSHWGLRYIMTLVSSEISLLKFSISKGQALHLFFNGVRKSCGRSGSSTDISSQICNAPKALTEPCTNNAIEYNALIISLQIAQQLRMKCPKVCSDRAHCQPYDKRIWGEVLVPCC